MRVIVALLLVLSPLQLAFAAPVSELGAVLAAAMKGNPVPAMGLTVIRGGKIAGSVVRGVRELGHADQVEADDLWQIGSNTKPMTAALIVRLAEQHRLSLDAPLWAMMPTLAAKARPEYRDITLRELLLHTSGLPHDFSGISHVYAAFIRDRRSLPTQRMAYLTMALNDRSVAPRGKEAHYSNTGYILAAAIAEHVTGVSFEALMQVEVFQPLHMTKTRFGLPQAIHGHLHGRVARADDEVISMFDPAGGVSTSLADWAKFCIDQLDGAKGRGHLLSTEGYRLLQSADATTGSGLGWGVDSRFMGRQGPMLSHAGSDGAWYSLVVLFSADASGLLVNANAGSDMGGEKADKAVLKALLPGLAPPAK